ncbi:MAG: hypothetical protein HC844_06335 [Tabrizicola sp.]|nr:hypothetical protein [Tabrizicola sp.]
MVPAEKTVIENVNTPGRIERVDRAISTPMRGALLAVLPSYPPEMTVAEAKAALLPHLPEEIFPGGSTAGWWLKAAQHDHEAKGVIRRAPSKPVRLFRREETGE